MARIVRHLRGTDVAAGTLRCRDDLEEPVVALTFDDGPSEWTGPILDLLGEAGARATFFLIGGAVPGREDVVERIRAEGHELGNHTMTHPRLDTVDRRRIAREIRLGNEAVARVVGAPPTVFRPPGLRRTVAVLEVARSFGFDPVVLASSAVDDYLRDSAEEIASHILAAVRPGAIVDLHDGRPPDEPAPGAGGSRADRWPTVGAVELLLARLRQYTFLTVSELIAR